MVREYGYEYDAVPDQKILEETKGKVTKERLWGALCLRSGRDALKAIAREYDPCCVLLPALSCDSMVFPFERYQHKAVFYKLNPDYSIDTADLENKIASGTCLFLYMDYFGCKAITDHELETLKKKYSKLVFIEDRTHNLIWEKQSIFQPDYTIASLRKWLPIPDGGLLWGKTTKQLAADTTFSEIRLRAQCMRHEYFKTGNENIKAEYRKIFSTVSDFMNSDEPGAMSAYSYQKTLEADPDSLRDQRRKNAEVLSSILSPYAELIQGASSALYVPFIVPNRNEIQKRLSAQGIFNTIIWPLSELQKRACDIAKRTTENMLAAPCDQRYDERDMEYIGKQIAETIKKVNG